MLSYTGVVSVAFLIAFPVSVALTVSKPLEQLIRDRQAQLPALSTWSPTPVPDPEPHSVPNGSPRLQRGLFECPCSPSNRSGSLPETDMKQMRDALKKSGGLEALNNPSPEVLNKVLSNLGEFAKATNALKRVLEKCRNVIRFEGCVNADAWLRGAHEEPSLCSFDSWTQKNIRGALLSDLVPPMPALTSQRIRSGSRSRRPRTCFESALPCCRQCQRCLRQCGILPNSPCPTRLRGFDEACSIALVHRRTALVASRTQTLQRCEMH